MLKGKTALVTGSTSGIGLAIAEALAGEGANIVMNGFGDAEEIETLRRDLEAKGVEAVYDGADMSDPDAIEAMMSHAAERFGGIDILVNNAGIQHAALLVRAVFGELVSAIHSLLSRENTRISKIFSLSEALIFKK